MADVAGRYGRMVKFQEAVAKRLKEGSSDKVVKKANYVWQTPEWKAAKRSDAAMLRKMRAAELRPANPGGQQKRQAVRTWLASHGKSLGGFDRSEAVKKAWLTRKQRYGESGRK
jgi:hypothetical protein